MKLIKHKHKHSKIFKMMSGLIYYDDRELISRILFDFVNKNEIEGDYLEFGVFQGKSLINAFHNIKNSGLKTKIFGFDSFEGLPEIKGIDKGKYFKKGEYKSGLNFVRNNLEKNGVDLKNVKLTKGWYDEVLNKETKKKLKIKKAAVIWIDCDLYESTVPVLEFITDLVQDGTVIAFDDWFCFKGCPEKGEQKAFKEWLEKNPKITATEFHKAGWHGMSFILHKK